VTKRHLSADPPPPGTTTFLVAGCTGGGSYCSSQFSGSEVITYTLARSRSAAARSVSSSPQVPGMRIELQYSPNASPGKKGANSSAWIVFVGVVVADSCIELNEGKSGTGKS